ncbi:MAG TPA: membrane protein insertion efficiency factor YidD [Gemmatimonadota bacterium]|nr:membrane protein insertion efficiency factor YidD [Gemmatimonadota bacterium]
MSTLRQRLKRPETYLVLIVVVIGLVVADTFQAPAHQVGSHAYVAGVHVYRAVGHRLLEGRIQCRYEPTCSQFSIEAVRTHGLRKGLELSVARIHSCKVEVPLGTVDPVPPRER